MPVMGGAHGVVDVGTRHAGGIGVAAAADGAHDVRVRGGVAGDVGGAGNITRHDGNAVFVQIMARGAGTGRVGDRYAAGGAGVKIGDGGDDRSAGGAVGIGARETR